MPQDTKSGGAGGPRAGLSRGLIIGLGAVGVVLIVVAAVSITWFQEAGVSGFERSEETVLFPALRERRDEISAMTVSTSAESFEIRQEGNRWFLADRQGYPVPAEKVEAILDFLDGLRGLYASTVDEPDYPQYGVAMPDETEAGAGQTIRFVNGAGEALAEFTIGITLSVPTDNGVAELTAVRRGKDARIRLVDNTIALPLEATEWLDRGLVDIPSGEIAEMVIRPPGEDSFPITRNEEGRLVIDGKSTRADLASPWVLDQVMASLQALEFVDVRKAEGLEGMDPEPWVVEVATMAGPHYTLRIYELPGAHWTTFSARAQDGTGAEAAEQFNARHGGWAYRLPPSTIDRLKSGPDQLG